MRRRSVFGWVALSLVLAWGLAEAQRQERAPGIPPQQSLVKIASVEGDGGASGSGVIVDARGYVLTAFHTVGYVDVRDGMPGKLRSPENRYMIAAPGPSGGTARFRWIATVLRGDVRHDVALLRIVARLGGAPLRDARFVPVSPGDPPDPGTTVNALGYPRGSMRVKRAQNEVKAIERNGFGQAEWIELARELPAGLAGGVVADSKGEHVGVPIDASGLLRPSSRLRIWWDELAMGPLRRVRIDGVRQLRVGEEVRDATWTGARRQGTRLYYLLPSSRPVEVDVEPSLPLTVFDDTGQSLREGRGHVAAEEGDPRRLVLGIEAPDEPTAFTVRVEGDEQAAAGSERRGRGEVHAHLPELGGGFFAGDRSRDRKTKHAMVVGAVRDALTGRPIPEATVVLSSPDLDLAAHLRAFLTGEIDTEAFREPLVVHGASDLSGRFALREVPRGRSYSLAVFAPGYRPTEIDVDVSTIARRVGIDTIRLTR